MRRYRPLTNSDQWDLAILLGVLVVAFASSAAVIRPSFVTRFFAFASQSNQPTVPTSRTDIAPSSPTLPNAFQRPELLPDTLGLSVEPTPPARVPGNLPVAPTRSVDNPPAAKPTPRPAVVNNYKWYDGTKYRYLKTLRMRVTAYAPDKRCCWPYPGTTTASGLSVKTNRGKLVAADTRLLPFNSLVSIPGYHSGETVPVLDRGGAIKGHRIDVLLPTFAQAQDWGSRLVDVKIYVPVDE